jgi:FAD/FMN-containing dehydrogenase
VVSAGAAARFENWSGSVAYTPRRYLEPRDEGELAGIVRDARRDGGTVRVVGTGHSSTGIVRGDDTLVRLEHFTGVLRHDRDTCTARVGAGTTLEDLGRELYSCDLALPNYGDVATQRIGGAIGTGTHGSGIRQGNLSTMLIGARLVDGRGEVVELDPADTGTMRAARVALGTLGIFTELTLQLVPAFTAHRREYHAPCDVALPHVPALVAANRSFDFYWYPRRDELKLRLVNGQHGGTPSLPWATQTEDTTGYGHQIIPTHSGIPHKFEEMEYELPYEAGLACFAEVRARVKARWRSVVGWRVLFRTVRGDDACLSPAGGRDTATISLHQNASLPWRAFFDDLEPVFLAHDGRPHWAKKHNLVARELAPRYPRWDDFARVHARFDPDGVFLTPYLRELLGVEPAR